MEQATQTTYLVVDQLLVAVIFLQQRNKLYDIRIVGIKLVSSPVETKDQGPRLMRRWYNGRECLIFVSGDVPPFDDRFCCRGPACLQGMTEACHSYYLGHDQGEGWLDGREAGLARLYIVHKTLIPGRR
jgi:hypothetical protein